MKFPHKLRCDHKTNGIESKRNSEVTGKKGANFDIRERSNLSLLRRPSASCEGSPLGDPAAVEAAADSGRDEEKKTGKKGDSTDPLERVRQKVFREMKKAINWGKDEKVKGIYGVGVLKKGKLPSRSNCEDKGTIPAASSAGAKRKEKGEKPTRKTQREGKVERINDNDKRTGR
ncbi:hypothetical protein GEV33_014375 [Tenebrio molitor]|uniref:Uncharacterized protein n=1 Tax=Tenebrio molitor TaxID=7067 RepID=A0A8J6L6N5_TENMO|nr:hypothetical protein GEV33_014375 [Tenebrio molitor]